MSQQVLPQYAPMVKALDENNQEVYIPAAIASGQTRDGKDELIVGAGNMVFDPSIGDNGMWVPVSEANPLETRVRHLETLIGAIAESPAANTVQARLKTLADRLGEAVEEPDENTLLARMKELETELTNIKNTLTDGTQKTTLTGQTVVDDEQLTVGETAVGLTPPPGATAAYITVEDGPIRYRIRGDGALPTVTVGHKSEDGDDIVLSSAADISAFRAIRSGSLDGILHVSYAEAVS